MSRQRVGFDDVSQEVLDLIVAACDADWPQPTAPALRRLGTVCRSLRQATLPHAYWNIWFSRLRQGQCEHFCRYLKDYPAFAGHVKRLTADTPPSTTNTPVEALPSGHFTSLSSLSMSMAYFLGAIGSIPKDTAPFPSLQRATFGGSSTQVKVDVTTIDAIWLSPALTEVRFGDTCFMEGESVVPDQSLRPIERITFRQCSISDAALQQLTSKRAVMLFSWSGVKINPFEKSIPRIFALEGVPAPQSEQSVPVPLDLFESLEALDVLPGHIRRVQRGEIPLPQSLRKLRVGIDTTQCNREGFLDSLNHVLKTRLPRLCAVELSLQGVLPEAEHESEYEAEFETESDSEDSEDPEDSEGRDEDESSFDSERHYYDNGEKRVKQWLELEQGDWYTGYPRYACDAERYLSKSKDGKKAEAEVEKDDRSQFQGYTSLQTLCRSLNIELKTEWTRTLY